MDDEWATAIVVNRISLALIALAVLAIGVGAFSQIWHAALKPRALASESPLARERRAGNALQPGQRDAFSVDPVVVSRGAPRHHDLSDVPIALVAVDAGRNRFLDTAFVDLPLKFTFVVDARGADAAALARAAQQHDDTLFVQVERAPNARKLEALQRTFAHLAGIASRHARGMAGALQGSGLAFLDERGDANPVTFVARNVTLLRRDLTLDDVKQVGYIHFMLEQARVRMGWHGRQIALVRVQPVTLRALRAFFARKADRFALTTLP